MHRDVERFNELLRRAHQTNRGRDDDERKMGLATPNDGPIDLRLGTAIEAIQAGVMLQDWNAVAEGLDMLYKLNRDIREGTCEPTATCD